MNKRYRLFTYLILPLLLACHAVAELHKSEQKITSYSSDYSGAYLTNVYWGDTHLHTSLSWDAYVGGNRLDPEAAYRFAKGEIVESSSGVPAKIRRPLDFLVVADHASNMGVMQGLEAREPSLLSSSLGQRMLSQVNEIENSDTQKSAKLSFLLFMDGFQEGSPANDHYRESVWKNAITLADKYNLPGQFTAFIGYEWTQTFYNLHRVVIFKDDAEKAGQVLPFSQYDSSDPEALWDYFSDYEEQTAGEVLAIPHNGNLSRGVMFALEDVRGEPLSVDYAKSRSRWEPLFEVTQVKGDSETHPLLSPIDQFADYETVTSSAPVEGSWSEVLKKHFKLTDYDHWVKKNNRESDKSWMHQYEYARSALKLGIEQQAKLGVNPFKFGMIGSTDIHSSLASSDESNFLISDPSSSRPTSKYKIPDNPIGYKSDMKGSWQLSAAGYAAVWATENTRESLFAAMKRKEVYASTGPRITVRFFGGWDYQRDDAFRPDLAHVGYSKGVPMGGDLTAAPDDKSPQFLIRAVKDPDGANLDRVQVIKGWHDKHGELHEKIYNVALSDGRKENGRGKVKPVGNTVDVPDASYTNTIGDPELAVVWQDPDFNKDDLAFYYLRVLEIPTPRWTAYDAKFFGLKDIPEEVPMVTQERAYTSPIWYTPAAFSSGRIN